MYCVKEIFQTQTEVKRSKFISFLVPYDQFKLFYQSLKEEYPKANHIIYIYRTLNAYRQIIENSSDDGEPKGAAATPTLKQMQGANLVESAIITVRYFGGIKLGVGGMVRAYSAAAKAVIDSATLETYEEIQEFRYSAPYAQQRQVEYHLTNCGIKDIQREFKNNSITWILRAGESQLSKLKGLLV